MIGVLIEIGHLRRRRMRPRISATSVAQSGQSLPLSNKVDRAKAWQLPREPWQPLEASLPWLPESNSQHPEMGCCVSWRPAAHTHSLHPCTLTLSLKFEFRAFCTCSLLFNSAPGDFVIVLESFKRSGILGQDSVQESWIIQNSLCNQLKLSKVHHSSS